MIIDRKEWGGPNFMPLHVPKGLQYVVVHHTDGAPTDPTPEGEMRYMRQIEAMHVNRGWVAVGYNFVIFPSGRIYEGRGWGVAGAHAGPTMNRRSLGVAFHLRGQHEFPSKAAVEACRQLLAEGIRKGRVVENFALEGHRDHMATACPGDKLYTSLVALRPLPAPVIEPPTLRPIPASQGWLRRLVGLFK